MSDAPVVVVGAGAAGLSAATHLQQAGQPVIVLEASDRVGGRMCTTSSDGYLVDHGAMIFAGGYTAVLSLLDVVGLRDQLQPIPPLVGFARDGKVHTVDTTRLVRSGIQTRVLSTMAKLRFGRVLVDAARIRGLLDDEDLSKATRFDTESAFDYGRRRADPEIYDYVIDAAIRGLLGIPGRNASAVDFFYTLHKFLGSRIYVMRDGLGSYADALASKLDVRMNARVDEVVETSAGVRVSWTDVDDVHQIIEARGCVLAVPGDRVPTLAPGLPDDVGSVLGALRYGSTVSVKFRLSRKPVHLDSFMVVVPRPVHEGVFALSVDHNLPDRAPPGKGLLGAYLLSDWAERLANEDDATVVETVLEGVERVVPRLADDVETVDVVRWHPSVVQSHPGLYRDLGRAYRARPRRYLHLAGDYFSSSNVHTATCAGARAARELVEVLVPDIGRSRCSPDRGA